MDNMSFLPEDYLERRAARRTNILCLTLFGIVMVGLVGAYVVSGRHDAEVRELHRQVNLEFEEAARRIEQLEQLQQQKKQMIHKAQVTGVLLERVPRSLLMAELINHMPATLSLTEMDLETRELRTTTRPRTAIEREQQRLASRSKANDMFSQIEVPETEMTVNLVGVAPTDVEVARFMTALGRHNMFYDVNLLFSEQTTISEQRMRQFRIELKVNQDVDFDAMEPTLVSRELKQNPMGSRLQIDESGELVAPGANVAPKWGQP
ncbi:PilN domain-containing protein [Phycisphaerales bacterium AB-hyl4]|uniref:PilN domain-containing protein n=1 Tax=Natronomicrosphaera hydrolytica TaxID=3242702 RepID=A0ABV4U242_9BACT